MAFGLTLVLTFTWSRDAFSFTGRHDRNNQASAFFPDQNGSVNYLDLPLWQLKLLGIECSRNGLFYKNQNPDALKQGRRYQYLCFMLTDDIYCTNVNFNEGEKIAGKGSGYKRLSEMPATRNAFDPVLITDAKGSATWDSYTEILAHDTKLVPVRINMTDLQMKSRAGWIIFWFMPGEELSRALDGIARTEDHLALPW